MSTVNTTAVNANADEGRADVRRTLLVGTPEDFVRDLGWHGFLWIIRRRLTTIYPADLFRSETYGVNWAGEHAGTDIDPGVRWATLLYLALDQLPSPENPKGDPR